MLAAGQYLPPPGALAARHFNRHIFDSASPGVWRSEKRSDLTQPPSANPVVDQVAVAEKVSG
jgi:cobaltochelatase CobN